jgi:predicted nucleotidyltransferase
MAKRRSTPGEAERWYRGTRVPRAVIRQFAREVARRIKPEKIILFGSHAYGRPHADSDVDILVIMPARNEIDQAVRIDRAVDPLFPLDLMVCTPKNIAWRLKEGDSFLHEVMTRGQVLYEKADGAMDAKGGNPTTPWPGSSRTQAIHITMRSAFMHSSVPRSI